jgi:hypothetical protein
MTSLWFLFLAFLFAGLFALAHDAYVTGDGLPWRRAWPHWVLTYVYALGAASVLILIGLSALSLTEAW